MTKAEAFAKAKAMYDRTHYQPTYMDTDDYDYEMAYARGVAYKAMQAIKNSSKESYSEEELDEMLDY